MKIFRIISILVMALCFSISVQAAPIGIKVAMTVSPGQAVHRAWLDGAKYLEEKSNGRYTFKIYDSGTLGNSSAAFQGVQFGSIHIDHDGSPNMTAFDPNLAIFDLPYLFPDYESVDRILDGPIGEKIKASLSSKGVTCVGFIANTFRGIFSNTAISSLADAKGKKIRATPSKAHIAGLKAFGFTPTPMAWTETVTGVQQKVITGFDCDLNFVLALRLEEIAPYVTMTEHMYSPHPLVVNTKWYTGLSVEDKAIFDDSFAFFLGRAKQYVREDGEKAKEILSGYGHSFVDFPEEEKAKWVEAARKSYASMPNIPQDLLTEILNELNKNN